MSAYTGLQASGQARQHNGNVCECCLYLSSLPLSDQTIVNTYYGEEKQTAEERREAQRAKDRKLFAAARSGQLRRIQYLLQKGADVDYMEMDEVGGGSTALHVAALKNHAAVVEALILAGADVHQTLADSSSTHSTTVDVASAAGYKEVVSALVLAGAKLSLEEEELPGKERAEPAESKCERRDNATNDGLTQHTSKEQVEETGKGRRSPGPRGAIHDESSSGAQHGERQEQELPWQSTKKDQRRSKTKTGEPSRGSSQRNVKAIGPMRLQANSGNEPRPSLASGEECQTSNVKKRSEERLGPPEEKTQATKDRQLWLAASQGNTQLVRYLIRQGVDLDCTFDDKTDTDLEASSSLHQAASYGYTAIAEALIAAGADIDQTTSHGGTALIFASMHGRTSVVDALLRAGANIDKAERGLQRALYKACLHGYEEIVMSLLWGGAEVDYKTEDEGCTALHAASKHAQTSSLVKALLLGGADPNICDLLHRTPLDMADLNNWAYGDQTAIIELLKEHGAERCKHSPQEKETERLGRWIYLWLQVGRFKQALL